ncbi:MAG: hypothetical protein V3W11_09540, partial [bacterium]
SGNDGTLVRISGSSIAAESIETNQLLSAVWFFDAASGWAATTKGSLFQYSGGFWTKGGYKHRAGINGLAFVDRKNGFACGDGGTILKYEYK